LASRGQVRLFGLNNRTVRSIRRDSAYKARNGPRTRQGTDIEPRHQHLAIPEVELEPASYEECDRRSYGSLGEIRARSIPRVFCKSGDGETDDQEISDHGEDSALGPELDYVVVQMWHVESWGIRLPVIRI